MEVAMNNQRLFSRRAVIKTSALAAMGLPLIGAGSAIAKETDSWKGLKVGVASYTLRKMSLNEAIKAIQRVGLKYVSIKDFHLPLTSTAQERRAVAQRFKDAGITPLRCGNITMQNDEVDV